MLTPKFDYDDYTPIEFQYDFERLDSPESLEFPSFDNIQSIEEVTPGGALLEYIEDPIHESIGQIESPSSSDASITPKPKKITDPSKMCPTFCAICGDKATGYHYEVAACNGCKTFFRRAVLGQRHYECLNEGACKNSMDKNMRVQCRKCRMDKCIECGMNPLAISTVVNPGGNTVVREILSKRKLQLTDGSEPSTSSSPKLFIHPQLVEMTMDRLIDELLHLEVAHQRLRRSTYAPKRKDGINFDVLLSGPSKLGIDYGDMPPLEEYPSFPPYVPDEIRIRDKIPFPCRRTYHKFHPKNSKPWRLVDLVYAVEYLKTFNFFHRLNEADKKTLAKNVTMQCAQITSSFFSYEKKTDITIYPDGIMPNHGYLPIEATLDRARHYGVIKSIKDINMDKTEYVLLKAILVCNPALENLSPGCREIMQEQREKYAKSLMSYVMARRGIKDGPSVYVAILAFVESLTTLAKKSKDQHTLIHALGLVKRKPRHKIKNSLHNDIMEP